jgi:DNA recombination protein RmuC
LQGVFGELARDSLKSNSELFLQLARERLARQQQDAAQALQQRETAIESLVQPIREALVRTEAQIQSIERERIDSFASIKTQMEGLALGQTCCRGKPAIWWALCAVRMFAANGARSLCGAWWNCRA